MANDNPLQPNRRDALKAFGVGAAAAPNLLSGTASAASHLLPFPALPKPIRESVVALYEGLDRNTHNIVRSLWSQTDKVNVYQTFLEKTEAEIRYFCTLMHQKQQAIGTLGEYAFQHDLTTICSTLDDIFDEAQVKCDIPHFSKAANAVRYLLKQPAINDEIQLASLLPIHNERDHSHTTNEQKLASFKRYLGYEENTPAHKILKNIRGYLKNVDCLEQVWRQSAKNPEYKKPAFLETESFNLFLNFLWEVSWSQQKEHMVNNVPGNELLVKKCEEYSNHIDNLCDELEKKLGVSAPEFFTSLLSNQQSKREKEWNRLPWIDNSESDAIGFRSDIFESADQIPAIVDYCLEHCNADYQKLLRSTLHDNPALATRASKDVSELINRLIPELMQEFFPDYWKAKQGNNAEYKKQRSDLEDRMHLTETYHGDAMGQIAVNLWKNRIAEQMSNNETAVKH